MSEIDKLFERRIELKRELFVIELSIRDIQKNCKHINQKIERERDTMEHRNYDYITCKDCRKSWHE